LQGLTRGLLDERPDVILVSTIPPFGIFAAYISARLRRVPLIYWVMDINPDEACAMGLMGTRSLLARFLEYMNKVVLKSAKTVIALDSQMAKRLASKTELFREIRIIPPWPHERAIEQSKSLGRRFRKEHGLDDKIVFMYSGNHSWVHPLKTILDAAKYVEYRTDIVFLFVGGGNEKGKVEEAIRNGARNVLSLPYQSFHRLGESLSAADVHLVVMGEAMVGIVHPCKIYGAMAVGCPILAVAPENSFIARIMDSTMIGFRRRHGDIQGVVQAVLALADMSEKERARLGENATCLIRDKYNQIRLRNQFIDILERGPEADD